MIRSRQTLLLLAVSLATLFGARADTWYVDRDNASGSQDGLSWGTAFTTIQPAIDAAYAHDAGEVWVAEGVYDEQRITEGTVDTGSVVLRPQVHVLGGFSGNEQDQNGRDPGVHVCVIDGATSRSGNPAYHVVYGAEGAILDGFTVRGGAASVGNMSGWGGGLVFKEVSGEVRNCVFISNSAIWGGAIAGFYSEVVIKR